MNSKGSLKIYSQLNAIVWQRLFAPELLGVLDWTNRGLDLHLEAGWLNEGSIFLIERWWYGGSERHELIRDGMQSIKIVR